MISAVGSRLAIVILLLLLQVLIFVLELCIFCSNIDERKWYTALRRWLGPTGITLVGVVLVSVTFAHPYADAESTGTQCDIGVDADIAGKGVRVAAMVQVCVLILVSLLGSFHPKATGAKEVGGGLILTSGSLAIALIVRMARGTLTPVDAAIGAMILDGQSIALSIQLATKETLTSRWQVWIAVLTQFFELSTIIVVVFKFNDRSFASKDCSCLAVFWWAWLGKCQPATSSLEPSVFWIYIACRFVADCQVSFHALWNTSSFDRAEKDGRDAVDNLQKLGGTLRNITYPHFSKHGIARYGEFPATVTFMYAFYGLLALTSLVDADITIRDLDLPPSSGIDSTGQVIALVVAVVTGLRALWLFGFLFTHDDSKRHGIIWPFKARLYNFSYSRVYISPPSYDHLPASLPLGSLIKDLSDPFGPGAQYGNRIPVPEEKTETFRMYNFSTISRRTHRTRNSPLLGFIRSIFSKEVEITRARCMEKKSFFPTEDYLRRCANQPQVQADLGAETKSVSVYIVVGVMIAAGLSVDKIAKPAKPAKMSTAEQMVAGHELYGQFRDYSPSQDQRGIYAFSVQALTVSSYSVQKVT